MNILKKMSSASSVARELVRRGFDVQAVAVLEGHTPVIDVAPNAACLTAVAYPIVTEDRVERMAMTVAGCRVQWRVS